MPPSLGNKITHLGSLLSDTSLLQDANRITKNTNKYFDPSKSENLINHFAINDVSFIKVQFKKEDGTITEKTISKDTINTKSDTLVKEATYASDLMNYKILSKMLNYKNSEDVEWFSIFEDEVLPFTNFREPFVDYSGAVGNTNGSDWWKYLNKNKPDREYKNSPVREALSKFSHGYIFSVLALFKES